MGGGEGEKRRQLSCPFISNKHNTQSIGLFFSGPEVKILEYELWRQGSEPQAWLLSSVCKVTYILFQVINLPGFC